MSGKQYLSKAVKRKLKDDKATFQEKLPQVPNFLFSVFIFNRTRRKYKSCPKSKLSKISKVPKSQPTAQKIYTRVCFESIYFSI